MTHAIIMAVDLSRRGPEITNRFQLWANATSQANMRLIVGFADRGSPEDARFRRLVSRHRTVEAVAVPAGAEVNLGALRNGAARIVRTGTLIFVDVDIHPDFDLFCALLRQVDGGAPIAMAPCLYLSKKGTAALLSGRSTREFLEDFRSFDAKHLLHLAMPSSVMAVRAEDYHAIGGFGGEYSGHGYEDFDFMLRLAIEKNLVRLSVEILADRPYRSPLLAEGFRAALGAICLPNLLEEKISLHMFHNRDNAEDYYLARKRNARLFQERFVDVVARGYAAAEIIPPMVRAFYAECAARKIDPARWHALFDARPRHMLLRRPFLSRLCYTLGSDRISRAWI